MISVLNECLVFFAENIAKCSYTDQAEEQQIEWINTFIGCIRAIIPFSGRIAVEYAIGIDIARLAGFRSFIPGIAVWISCHLTGHNRTRIGSSGSTGTLFSWFWCWFRICFVNLEPGSHMFSIIEHRCEVCFPSLKGIQIGRLQSNDDTSRFRRIMFWIYRNTDLPRCRQTDQR